MKKEKYNVAVVGATGAVGEQMREVLEEREFPVGELRFWPRRDRPGQFLPFQGKQIRVEVLKEDSFKDIDIGLFSAGGSVSAKFAPLAVDAGAVVVDNTLVSGWSRTFRWWFPKSTPRRSPATKTAASSPIPIARRFKWSWRSSRFTTRRASSGVVVSTYQSVSGAGRKAMDELSQQVAASFQRQGD